LDLSTPASSRTGTLQSSRGDSLASKPTLAISTADTIVSGQSESPETRTGSAAPKNGKEFDQTTSPTLPPISFNGIGDPDDDDLLSSGQVSPVGKDILFLCLTII
jgi:hypothetical protein